MTDACLSRTTVGASGAVTVRQRPSLLLMKILLSADEATLELRLAKLKKQCEFTSPWLKELGAVRVEYGEPHFADQADKDPRKAMQAAARAMAHLPVQASSGEAGQKVNVVLTAMWDIASMSAEETLVLVDRLRFETTSATEKPEAETDRPAWPTPEESLREIMSLSLGQKPTDDGAPQFLFIARLTDEQLERASAEAFSLARKNTERLAQAVGMRLGELSTIHFGFDAANVTRTDKMMDRQRCGALLAGTSYDPGQHEIVSDDPRSAEFAVSVNVSYYLESPTA